MRFRTVALSLFAAALAGCSTAPVGPPTPGGGMSFTPGLAVSAPAALQPETKKHHYVYWTLFAGCSYPQVQFARVPLKATSKQINYYCREK